MQGGQHTTCIPQKKNGSKRGQKRNADEKNTSEIAGGDDTKASNATTAFTSARRHLAPLLTGVTMLNGFGLVLVEVLSVLRCFRWSMSLVSLDFLSRWQKVD